LPSCSMPSVGAWWAGRWRRHLQASSATAALTMALAARCPTPGSLIHHSDRGVQYACGDYTALLAAHDIQPSRVGNPYDNAKAESFMKTFKHEEVDGRTYRDAHHARRTKCRGLCGRQHRSYVCNHIGRG
jgi:transposase InsO family protein